MFPSSNWLGHHSFTVKTRDRAPVGMPNSMRVREVVSHRTHYPKNGLVQIHHPQPNYL